MVFRSYADLSRLIHHNLWRIPADVDLIAAVPRSGIIPASMLALALNLPTTDVEGLVTQRPIATGQSRQFRRFSRSVLSYRHVLVIDDTVHTGRNFELAREMLAGERPYRVTYAAVYASPEAASLVDLHFETCAFPRVFEWNYLHQATLAAACIDIDGVLCADPTADENDDGPRYLEFLRGATPRFQSDHRVYHLVTSRLERYRSQTEDWLQRHHFQYERLSMLDLPSAAERRRLRAHATFKGRVFREDARAEVFVESEATQAPVIAALAGKPVICVGNQQFYCPPAPGAGSPAAGAGAAAGRTLLTRLRSRLGRWRRG